MSGVKLELATPHFYPIYLKLKNHQTLLIPKPDISQNVNLKGLVTCVFLSEDLELAHALRYGLLRSDGDERLRLLGRFRV